MITVVGSGGIKEDEPVVIVLMAMVGKCNGLKRGVTTGGNPRLVAIGKENPGGGLPNW